jgi:hypothetical protein
MLRFGRYLTMVSLLLVVCGLPSGGWAQEKRKPVMVEGKTIIPLRVLARPFSHIYKEPDESKAKVEENVPTFKAYYVYTRPEVKATATEVKGWYEVGSDVRGTVLGWMRADDVLEWKQNMTLAYTHPDGRKPVLMFEKREALLDMIKAQGDQRQQRANELYNTLQSKKIPTNFPVRSVEPDKYVDINTQFYLLPILEFGEIGLDKYESRILKVAAAVLKGERGDQDVIKPGSDYVPPGSGGASDIELLKKLEMDIVFVIDTTASMQPVIDATLAAVRDIARFITRDAAISKSVHFGLWGYRDSTTIPGIEYLTKNFTPTLQLVENFEPILQGVRESPVGSEGFEEDMFSGMHDAMTKTAWTPKAMRFIVLVADAPSHWSGDQHAQKADCEASPPSSKCWNHSGQNEETLRRLATESGIYIAALHARAPEPQLDRLHALAEKQFRTLATNPGTQDAAKAAYWTVNELDTNAFAKAAQEVAGTLVEVIAAAKKGGIPTAAAATTSPAATKSGSAQPSAGKAAAANMGHAALVQWIGRETEAKAPHDVIAWVVDKDLLDPALASMEVRLLINKREIDELKKVLQGVMTAGRKGQMTGQDFFSVLKTSTTLVVRGEQGRLAQAKNMTEVVPEFLEGLPYKSDLMALTDSLWSSWSTDQQDEFLKAIDAKIQLYQTIHDASDKWIEFHKGDAADEYVYPIALESLP